MNRMNFLSLTLVGIFGLVACGGAQVSNPGPLPERQQWVRLPYTMEFASAEDDLTSAQRATLAEVVSTAHTRPDVYGIIVEGHTDQHGTAESNQRLSLRRADSVRDELRALGVRIPIYVTGHGESSPIGSDRANRRVEFHVLVNESAQY